MWTSTRPELDAVPCCEACRQVQAVLRWMEFERVMRRQRAVLISAPLLAAVVFLIIRFVT